MPGFLSPPDMNPTAWIIDKDHLSSPGDDPADSDAGLTGPSDAPDALLERLKANKSDGVKFRMLDSDDELYYTGRIIALNDDGTEMTYPDCGEEFFRPLWDYGTPGAGAVEIQYKDAAGAWVGL